MSRWFYAVMYLLFEANAARRDARVRFLNAQVDILRRKLGGNRVIPSPGDRRRLLAIGAELKHDVSGVIGIVSPLTYRRWVVEQSEGRCPKPVGRPKIARNVRALVKRLANENAGWGYRRIVGELRKLRLRVAKTTVKRILRESGLMPSPTRRSRGDETVWRKFLRLHLETMVACDFFTKAVITPLGPKLAYVLMFIHVGTRRVFLSPATYNPDGRWVEQQARNVLMWVEDRGVKPRFLIRDRDTKYSGPFDRLFKDAGVTIVKIPRLVPEANSFAESWVASIRRECLNHFTCFSRGHLDHITQTYAEFYNTHRPHQGLGNRTLTEAATGPPVGIAEVPIADNKPIKCQRLLGGLLRHYYRAA